MAREYSLYEAKAKLSAIVRRVREGQTAIITVHGVPAAELRPARPEAGQSVQERIADLEARGLIQPAVMNARDPRAWPRGKRSRGALKRFLAERD